MHRVVEISALEFIKATHGGMHLFITRLIEKHGPVLTLSIQFFPMYLHILCNPFYMKHVLDNSFDIYIKPSEYMKVLDVYIPDNLFITNNKTIWEKDRHALTPLFSDENVRLFARKMVEITEKSLEKWEDYAIYKKPMEIDWQITLIALANLRLTLFGGAEFDYAKTNDLFSEISFQGVDIFDYIRIHYYGIPGLRYLRFKKNFNEICALADHIVAQSLSGKIDPNNIVNALAKVYKDEINNPKILQHFRNQVILFLFAGHETTSAMLVWLIVYISRYPTVLEKLENEVDRVLSGRLPTFEDIEKLVYCRAALDEALRLQPSFSMFGRKAICDDTIGKLTIKKGDLVIVPPYHLHRLNEFWPNPEAFDPDRFLNPLPENYKYAYIPFGEGQRNCIGRYFSIVESIIVLSMIVQRYRLWLTPDTRLTVERSVSNRLNRKITMTVHKRNG